MQFSIPIPVPGILKAIPAHPWGQAATISFEVALFVNMTFLWFMHQNLFEELRWFHEDSDTRRGACNSMRVTKKAISYKLDKWHLWEWYLLARVWWTAKSRRPPAEIWSQVKNIQEGWTIIASELKNSDNTCCRKEQECELNHGFRSFHLCYPKHQLLRVWILKSIDGYSMVKQIMMMPMTWGWWRWW